MRTSLFFAAVILSIPAFADEVKSGVVYDHCTPKANGFMEPAYKLDSEGELNFNPKDKRIISWDAKKGVLVYQDFWVEDAGKNDVIPKNKLQLTREAGRPVSLEIFYDTKAMKAMYTSPTMKEMPMSTSFETKFEYKDNKCSVKQMVMKYDNGKKQITYDSAVCDKLLKVVKKATYKKLNECKAAFSQMSTILQDFRKSAEESGSEAGVGMFGSTVGVPPQTEGDIYGYNDKDYLALMMVTGCSMVKNMYGETADMGDMGMAYAPFVGGGISAHSKSFGGTPENGSTAE